MPDIVTTHILNLLPIKDAVRTSILARNWRFKWTLLTQLIFDYHFFTYLTSQLQENIARDISRLFIHLKGPITKFVFYVPYKKVLNDKNFCQWVMFLSRKGIREFTIENFYDETLIKLPTHLFSCHELRHLTLFGCEFPSPPTFGSFPKLLSLDLEKVTFSSGFCDIITLCPLLEMLDICDSYPITKVKLVEIAKLKNLEILYLPLIELDSTAFTNSLIVPGEGYFPKLQVLYLSFWYSQFDGIEAPRKLICDSFSSVKTLTLEYVDFYNSFLLPFAFELIWRCPNLQTLMIEGLCDSDLEPSALCPSKLEYIKMGQLQLVNVVFESFRGLGNELILIKYLLAYTPLLQNITIRPAS